MRFFRHLSIDAKWIKKRNKSYFSYKNHTKVDKDRKFILLSKVTSANVHDSQVISDLLDDEDRGCELWADSAYSSSKVEIELEIRGIKAKINKKGSKNKKLSEVERESNKILSKVRCRVEHVFGQMKYGMGMRAIRCIGISRAESVIELMNLTYNLRRFIFYKEKTA